MSPKKLTQHVQWDLRVATKVIAVESLAKADMVQWVAQLEHQLSHFQQLQLRNQQQ
jgi:hypothetical protein